MVVIVVCPRLFRLPDDRWTAASFSSPLALLHRLPSLLPDLKSAYSVASKKPGLQSLSLEQISSV